MTCDSCPEPATFTHRETACQRNHCGECIGNCAACQSEIAAEIGDERV